MPYLRVWLQPQPVNSLTHSAVSHGGQGDGKETHKHRPVGRADMPAWGSHTQAPVVFLIRGLPESLKACFLLVSCPSFAPAL